MRRAGTTARAISFWRESYGPIFRVVIGGHPVIVISDPDIVWEAVSSRGDIATFRRGIYPGPTATVAQRERDKKTVLAADGDYWKLLR